MELKTCWWIRTKSIWQPNMESSSCNKYVRRVAPMAGVHLPEFIRGILLLEV